MLAIITASHVLLSRGVRPADTMASFAQSNSQYAVPETAALRCSRSLAGRMMMGSNLCRFWLYALLACVGMGAMGCQGEQPEEPEVSRPAFEGERLKVAVIDDADLAAVVEQLSQEWEARTGAEVAVVHSTADEILQAGKPEWDVVLYPEHLIGPLAERGWLLEISDESFADEQYKLNDVFPALRYRATGWDNKTLAVSFGSAVPVLGYRVDLLEKLGRKPPQTWEEYQQTAALLADRTALGELAPPEGQPWRATAEPLAEGDAAILLLARAAAYSRHPAYFYTLFENQTMEPRIASAAFRRALEELMAAAHLNGGAAALSGTETFAALQRGECGMAIGWSFPRPQTDDPRPSSAANPPLPLAFSALPGSTTLYLDGQQRQAGLNRVPLLPGWGRLGSVSTSSNSPTAGAVLLLALSGEEWGTQVSSIAQGTAPYRRSQLSTAEQWAPEADLQAARQWAGAQADSLMSEDVLFALRIPGHDEYLSALDQAVRKAVAREATPQRALVEAAAEWRKITARLGFEPQRDAYQRSVEYLP